MPKPRLGWQQQASNALERHHHDHAVWPRLREHERAMMQSQRGPLASVPFVSSPSDAYPDRALLLRRLRLPLPLSVRSCRCGRPLDALSHHRAACATAGVLGRRSWALESAAARVCREGGARVRPNVFVRDLDLLQHTVVDGSVWRSWQTGYLSMGEPTRHWFHPCTGMAERYEVQPRRTVKLWRTHAEERSAHTPNWLVKGAGLGLSSWELKLGVGGPRRQWSS